MVGACRGRLNAQPLSGVSTVIWASLCESEWTTKTVAHVLLFLLAIAVFYFGLGVGLQYNSNLGSALWVAAAAIALLNVMWIVRSRR